MTETPPPGTAGPPAPPSPPHPPVEPIHPMAPAPGFSNAGQPPPFPPDRAPLPPPPGPAAPKRAGRGLYLTVVLLALAVVGLGAAAILVLRSSNGPDAASDTASTVEDQATSTTMPPKVSQSDLPTVMRSLVGVSSDSEGTGGISGAEEECLVELFTERLAPDEISKLTNGQADAAVVGKIAPAFDQCLRPESLASIYATMLETAYAQNQVTVTKDQAACAGRELASKVTFAQVSKVSASGDSDAVASAIAESARVCGIGR